MFGLSRLLFAAGFLCVGLASLPAVGQSDAERSGARAAAESGAQAYSEGRYQEALDLFTRAESLVHAPPHLLFIARSQEKLGKLVAAREAYNKIIREKLPDGAPAAFVSARESAAAELESVQARIPSITIKVEGAGAASATVTVDGNPVPKALVGIPYPIDPGEHEFQAVAGAAKSDVVTRKVDERARENVVLALSGGGDGPGGATSAADGAGPRSTDPASPQTAPAVDEGRRGSKVPAVVALGVGAVGVGLGTVFLVQRSSKKSDANALFDECAPSCSRSQEDDIKTWDDDAASAGTLSVVGFAVGAVGIGTGITLLLVGGKPSQKAETNARFVRPRVGLGQIGLYGRF